MLLAGCVTPLRGDRPVLIAHRGASAHAPENTLAAFEKAHAQGADYFELDCRLSGDNQVVVLHDGTLKRTTGVDLPLRKVGLEDLRGLDAGAWFSEDFRGERIPTLGESLAYAKDRIGVYVEIKPTEEDAAAMGRLLALTSAERNMSPALRAELRTILQREAPVSYALTRGTVDSIRNHRMGRHIVIQSFSPVICFITRYLAPHWRTELLIAEDKKQPERWQRLVDFGMLIGVHGFNVNKDALTPERLSAFQAAGKTVAVWTVNDQAEIDRFTAMGVDGIITNHPERVVRTGR